MSRKPNVSSQRRVKGHENRSEGAPESIQIDNILPNPYQIRRTFNEESLLRLANSIASSGLLNPIMVRPHPQILDYYQLAHGERRLKAVHILGWTNISAVVRELTDREMAEISMVENLMREDINPIEEARGYELLRSKFDYSVSQIAKLAGKSRSFISNSLRLLNLDPFLTGCVLCKTMHPWHARAIMALPEDYEKYRLADLVMDWALSVKETMKIVALVKNGKRLFSWERSIKTDGIRIHPCDDFNPDVDLSTTVKSLSLEGQKESIDILVTGTLINGAKTLFAAKELGWTTIWANIWFFTDWLRSASDEKKFEPSSDVKLSIGIIPEPTTEQKERVECLAKQLFRHKENYPILIAI